MRNQKRVSKGFTIIELLIVASLFTVIGTVVAFLFTRGHSAYRHGESHIEIQRTGRDLGCWVTPFLGSMFHAVPSGRTIIVPETTDPNIQRPFVQFRTTEDWLDGAYPSQTTSSRLAQGLGDLGVFEYRINQEAATGNILLEKMELTLDETAPSTTVLNTRTLVRQKASETISNLQFTLQKSNLLLLTFRTSRETRGAANQPLTVNEDFQIVFNLPTKSV